MTATEGRIKPQSISNDIAAIEKALVELSDIGDQSWTLHASILAESANPARLRRVLDTMQALSGALKDLEECYCEAGSPMYAADRLRHRKTLMAARAALALYEGKQ